MVVSCGEQFPVISIQVIPVCIFICICEKAEFILLFSSYGGMALPAWKKSSDPVMMINVA
jgi:hypothetical protein